MVREEFRRQRPRWLEGQEAMGYRPVSLTWVIGGRGTITKGVGEEQVWEACAESTWECICGTCRTVSTRHQEEARVRRKGGAWLNVMSQTSYLPRLGCGGPPCSPMPHSPEECRRLRTCSECLARHPRTLQPGDGEVNDGGGGGKGAWLRHH